MKYQGPVDDTEDTDSSESIPPAPLSGGTNVKEGPPRKNMTYMDKVQEEIFDSLDFLEHLHG